MMAQAARQNLRMQKELKLLLTDPPPGVSLSSSSSSSVSLTNINAEMKGPEGTVYENGVFHIKIQIPDRYPFQPPNVTFATPIYHPNIDTGGRICLDILNLPPKGAWQPSLNISTVLMSIGLLLSEPNPDDGLMCEASREYKYNRQTFDQKARSMTEKYAKPGFSIGSGSTPANPSTLMAEVKEHSIEPKTFNDEYVDRKRLGRVSRKLSLESSTTSQKRDNDNKNNVADGDNSSSLHPQTLSPNAAASFCKQDGGTHNEQTPHLDDTSKAESECTGLHPGKLSGRPHKLSLKSSASLQIMPIHDKENVMQSHSFHSNPEIASMTCNNPFQPKTSEHVAPQLHQDHEVDSDNGAVNQSQKKVLGIRRKLSLHSSCSTTKQSGTDSVRDTNSSLPLSKSGNQSVSLKSALVPPNENDNRKQPQQVYNEKSKGTINMTKNKLGFSKKLPLGASTTSKWEDDGNKENVPPNYQMISENPSTTSPSFITPQVNNSSSESRQQDHDQGVQNGMSAGHKKSSGSGKKVLMQSSGAARTRPVDQKVSLLPLEKLPPQYQNPDDVLQLTHAGLLDDEALKDSAKQGSVNCGTKDNEDDITDAVIVLDSEDSEEEVKVPTRSRLSIARKPLAGKRKAKA